MRERWARDDNYNETDYNLLLTKTQALFKGVYVKVYCEGKLYPSLYVLTKADKILVINCKEAAVLPVKVELMEQSKHSCSFQLGGLGLSK